MRAAFVIFEGMTALDFVGAYDPLTRLGTMKLREDFAWDVCAFTEEVRDNTGLRFAPTRVGQSLGAYDLLVVPGGYAARELTQDAAFLGWLRTGAACDLKASVCTGSLLLGAAGFLEGKRATTHPSALEELKRFCRVSEERIVDEGDVVTAGGVTAAIDLGLHLCERLAGAGAREKIRRQMDYHPVQ
ncbi:MAG TPA: DJ-1/PfpI family protein [Pyrinomonadaceae bacterium]